MLAAAAATPGLKAVGVDLAATPIAEAQQAVDEIGLTNAEFHQARRPVTSTTGKLGEFDYVVAHGVYGWMPEEADDALLATIKASLAPDGIAYVSFNAQPGGYFRRMLRDAGLWHARKESGALAQAAKAQELYKFLAEHRVTEADTYGALLSREIPVLADAPSLPARARRPGGVLEAALVRRVRRARRPGHGLGYVGEADLFSLRSEMLPDGVEPLAWELVDGDRVAFENLSDVLTARHFRQSVICHAGRVVSPAAVPERAQRLHWAVRPNAEPLEVGLTADAFRVLDARRPRAVGFDALREEAGRRPARAGRGAAGRLPARAPDAARRAAAGGGGAGRAAPRVAVGALAGGARRGHGLARLHARAHGGAGGACADHAARRHA